jgi:hypothetical protein
MWLAKLPKRQVADSPICGCFDSLRARVKTSRASERRAQQAMNAPIAEVME